MNHTPDATISSLDFHTRTLYCYNLLPPCSALGSTSLLINFLINESLRNEFSAGILKNPTLEHTNKNNLSPSLSPHLVGYIIFQLLDWPWVMGLLNYLPPAISTWSLLMEFCQTQKKIYLIVYLHCVTNILYWSRKLHFLKINNLEKENSRQSVSTRKWTSYGKWKNLFVCFRWQNPDTLENYFCLFVFNN